jgi:cardiolipin synthase
MNSETTTQNHRIELLENGKAFYEHAFAAIRGAKNEVLLETFIWFWDDVGKELLDALETAARNGAAIDVTIDGWGTVALPDECHSRLSDLGIHLHVFDPTPQVLGWRPKFVGRMHRKLLVVDNETAFVGGINYGDDHVVENGPESKQDYAVMVQGPVVSEIREFMRNSISNGLGYSKKSRWRRSRHLPDTWQQATRKHKVLFVTRDNADHQNDIERFYLMSIRSAKHEIAIANAYFFPSYRMLRHLRKAVARGVCVKLILQGNPDMDYARAAATTLYDYLLDAGVELYEFVERPLHGKIAVFDDEWSTVGSSNLDPLSFSLNLESNLFIFDATFGKQLRERIGYLLQNSERVQRSDIPKQTGWRHLVRMAAFHISRHYPRWLQKFPGYKQEVIDDPQAPDD